MLKLLSYVLRLLTALAKI